ncbi:hypothetical protein Q5752_002920 [Cryptotrichosporon argae]
MSSTSSSKLTFLPPDYLASLPPSAELTLPALLETQDRLSAEAREACPYSFDECSYGRGHVRQSVWSCLDCGEKGVCYGCSIACHTDHRLVELWTRRAFRCDCPTSAMPSSSARPHVCRLYRPSLADANPDADTDVAPYAADSAGASKARAPPNARNRYHADNFAGRFCRCGRPYDPETEDEAMICCIACEDWLHESCLNLRPPRRVTAAAEGDDEKALAGEAKLSEKDTEARPPDLDDFDDDFDDDDDDDEADVLIRSDEYDGLICAACVGKSEYVKRKAGGKGWMMIVRDSNGWKVIGREGDGQVTTKAEATREEVIKRPADDDAGERKRFKLEGDGGTALEEAGEGRGETVQEEEPGGKGDVFLAHDVRAALAAELDPETAAALPFPLVDDEIYEPPRDADDDETLEDATARVIGSLPRVQAIEALHGYQAMKDGLVAMLAQRAATGQAVTRDDVTDMFERLRRARQ